MSTKAKKQNNKKSVSTFELNENNIKLFIELKQKTKRNNEDIKNIYVAYLNKRSVDLATVDNEKILSFKIDDIKYFKYDLDKCVEELQKNNILITKKQIIKIFNFLDFTH